MKIRIKDNSVRFRLTQSEVAALGENGFVTNFTEFVGRPFVYSVEIAEEEHALSAVYIENSIVMRIPKTLVEEWINTDRVGFSGEVGDVKLLIEKDFVCIDNTDEDQSDNYPNPSLKC